MSDSEIIWRPTSEVIERARLTQFMRTHGVASLEALQRRSVDDAEWYWDAVSKDLGFRWMTPYRRVLDTSRGIAFPRWFEGGLMNLSDNCVDRHVDEGRGEQPAIIWEAEDGQVRTITYRELSHEVNRLSNVLKRLGVEPGDAVGLFLPMCPEAAIAIMAICRIGAIYSPSFSGYGAQAVSARLVDCEAKVLITADGFPRRGQIVKMKETADEAAALSPSVKHLLVLRRLGREVAWTSGRDVWWHEAMARESAECAALPVEADRPCCITYTSGTTGKPKGVVLTQGGLQMKIGHDAAYFFDVGSHDRFFWLTDMGWVMGTILILGGLTNGATLVLFEGTPDYPKPDRLWAIAERHHVTVMGLSPTAVRALMPYGADWARQHELTHLRIFGSTGEPWNPEPYRWVFEHVGRSRIPIINYSGGTEISGGIVTSFPIAPIKPCSFNGPAPGMAADVFGEDGKPVRGQVGELVITRPWPGMTAGFWKDPDRYLETYWSRWPDVWVHGDWAYIDEDGFWFVTGRSDDTLKIAGKRLGPAEVESVLVSHPAVAESAAVGVPHEVKGEAVICFVVLRPDTTPGEKLRAELSDLVAHQMGKALKPERVVFVADLPKTRSAKIMRRVIRATYLGNDPGDLSSLDNPASIKAISEAR
ncbi:MAG TPA: acetate--CoA ligase [Methylomirabilota bacterium]|nr:acetate--CoA ligase [Methylomirabilota bacterium]